MVLSTQAAHALSAEDYVNRGNNKYRLRDYQGAIIDYTMVLEIDPQKASAYYFRGIAKNESGDYEGAIADYNKVIEINPQYADVYNNRGYAKYNLKDFQEQLLITTRQ